MVALTLSLSACDEPTPAGVAAISPANAPTSTSDDWSSYWSESEAVGGMQGVNVNWDADGAGQIPSAILSTEGSGLMPVVVLGIDSAVGNPDAETALRSMLETLVTHHTILYLGLGNEIDRNPLDGRVQLINDLTDFIHSLSSPTTVFTVFQYEHMLSQDDPAELVASVPNVDLVAFTSYPFMRYSSPDQIPEDYYAPIAAWTAKPIAFTEVAWPSRMNFPGYPTIHGSEGDQVSFINLFHGTLLAGLDVRFTDWYSLHDTADWYESEPLTSFKDVFASCGLMRNGTDEKPALAAWSALNSASVG